MAGRRLRRRPSAIAAIACLALLLALAGGVYATAKGSKIGGGTIKKSSIAGNRFKKNTVAGKQVKESKLGTVAHAEVGNRLEGEHRFNLKLGFGESRDIFIAGPLIFTATCLQNTTDNFGLANMDVARILVATSSGSAVFRGADRKLGTGPADLLEPTTPESDRVLVEDSEESDRTHFDADNDEEEGGPGVYSSTGVGVTFNDDGLGLGVNIGGPGCVYAGTAIVETP